MRKAVHVGIVAVLCLSLMACSVDQVLSDINLVIQTAASLETAVGALSPADAAALQLFTGFASAGLAAIQADYDTYEKSKGDSDLQKLQAGIAAFQSNLNQNLAALHISSSGAVQKITAWTNLVASTMNAILNALSAPKSTAMARVILILPTPESLQARWQSEVCLGDSACGSLVKVHHVSR